MILISNVQTQVSASMKINWMALTIAFERAEEKFCGFWQTEKRFCVLLKLNFLCSSLLRLILGFPEDITKKQQFRLLGNSLNVLVVTELLNQCLLVEHVNLCDDFS